MKASTYLLWAGALVTSPLAGQTFVATKAVHEVKCGSFLGIFNKCSTIESDRIHSTFTRNNLHVFMFGETWATASHCTRIDYTEQKCRRSVFVSTDPAWNRVVWGQSDNFLRAYGTGGTASQGPGHFLHPLGVDITRREGEWHVAAVADAGNNRVVLLAIGYTCKCVRWLGVLDGSESGVPLRDPHDVAWDPVITWSFADDRVFIVDTDNHRIVVYQVSLDPVAGTMTKHYLGTFGTQGSGASQLSRPQGIAVRTWTSDVRQRWRVGGQALGDQRAKLLLAGIPVVPKEVERRLHERLTVPNP